MNKRDEAYRSMVEKVLLMLDRYINVWKTNKNNTTGNKQIAEAYANLKASIAELDKYLDIQKNFAKV